MRTLTLALLASLLAPTAVIAQTAVVESNAPEVVAAPGLGLIPNVSAHTGAMPTLYDLDKQPIEQISPLVQRQYLSGAGSTIVKWTVKPGGIFPLHHHIYEQITWITKGRCEVYSQQRKFILTAGSVLIIPANVPHEFRCTEDTIDMDFFAPARQDWADGAPSIAAKP